MTTRTFLIFAFILTLQSCDYYLMYSEMDNLKYLAKEMGADKCEIVLVKEKNNLSGDTIAFSFIELNLINSNFYENPRIDKTSLTSYCAIKAFELFDPKIWNGKDGINIIFDGKNDWPKDKMYYYKLNELQDITKIINNSNALLTSLQEANRRFENLDLIYSPVPSNTVETKDSLEIATYFSKNLFKDNKDLVLHVCRAFKNIKGIEDSNKKYYYQKVVVADTIGSKIIKSDYYKVNLSVVLPDNNVHYIKYFIKADNLSEFAAIEM